MPATVQEALRNLAEGFRLDQVPPSPADAGDLAFRLTPPVAGDPDTGRIFVTDLVPGTEIQDGPVDLSLILKNLRFATEDIADPTVIGGVPVLGGTPLSLGIPLATGDLTRPGVPGSLGRLTGTLPVPVAVLNEIALEVAFDVRWRIRDERGEIVAGDEVGWKLGAGGPGLEGSGGSILPPLDHALDLLNVTFAIVVELTNDPAVVVRRSVEASVRASAGGVSSGFVDLPPLEVVVAPIAVPTVAVLFRDTNFRRQALVVVPANSPLTEGTVRAALQTVNDTLDPIKDTVGFAGFFVSELGPVSVALASATIIFRKADSITNLNDIDLESGFINDIEAEDELSSLALIGPPRRQIQGFNARSFSTSEGQMNATVGGGLLVRVSSLHSRNPAVDPPADPALTPLQGRVDVPVSPRGTRFFRHQINSFGDEFSSLRFGFG